MEITKAQWSTDGDTFTIGMPMTKIDVENRLVSGWASLDNPDLQGDIVKADASERAFARFRGNIREMHQPIAVGRMVSYKPEQYYDEKTGNIYNGIYVTARVSKGAQDTWEKVLDGTLQAFSIKGPIVEAENVFEKGSNKTLRVVKEYDLEELSLVDSGGNQLANIVSIQKDVNGQQTVSGTVTESKSANVFYCITDKAAKTSTEDSEECPNGHKMENIGWIEYEDDNLADKIAEVVSKYNSPQNAEQELPATNEGGVNVADENDNKEEGVVPGSAAPADNPTEAAGQVASEAAASTDVDEVSGNTEEKVEKAADVSEVEVEELDFAKMFGDLQTAITVGLEKASTDSKDAVTEVSDSLQKKFDELAVSHAELVSKFDSLQENLAGVEKSLAAVESETAFKKSGDLGGSAENTLEKSSKGSKWGGFFLGTSTNE